LYKKLMAENILLLTYWYPSNSNKSSGIFIKRHAAAIHLINNVVVVSLHITDGRSIFKKTSEITKDENNVETHQVCIASRYRKLVYLLLPVHYFILRKYLRRQLCEHKFSTVHSNVIFPCAIVGHYLSKKMRCRHIITEHWTKIDKFFSISLYRFAGKIAFDRANAITCVSESLAATVKKYTDNKNVTIIPNVIDPNEFYFNPAIQKNRKLTFIAAAHWAQFKNPFYFLDALELIYHEKQIPEFKVALAGTGEQLSVIRQKNYHFEISYLGAMDVKGLNTEFNRSHVFLHGSDFETFSVVIAEALMCGLPCVVSPVGIGPEVIHSGNGFVTNNTVSDWKQKILLCCASNYDHAAISEQLKHKFDLATVGRQFKDLYSSLV